MCIKIYDECKSASQMKRGVQSTKRNYVIYVGLWLRNARQLGRRDDWKSLASQSKKAQGKPYTQPPRNLYKISANI